MPFDGQENHPLKGIFGVGFRFFCQVSLDISRSFQQDDQEIAPDLLHALERLDVRSLLGDGDHNAT